MFPHVYTGSDMSLLLCATLVLCVSESDPSGAYLGGHCGHYLNRSLLHWLQCLVAAVTPCVLCSSDNTARRVISPLCRSTQKPVIWVRWRSGDQRAVPEEGRCSKIKDRQFTHYTVCVCVHVWKCTCAFLHANACVLSLVSFPRILEDVSPTLTAHSRKRQKKRDSQLYFYNILPKGAVI